MLAQNGKETYSLFCSGKMCSKDHLWQLPSSNNLQTAVSRMIGRFRIICTNCIHCSYFAFNCPMACKFTWHAMSGRAFRLKVWRIKVGSSWIHVAILAPLLPLPPLLHDSPPMSRSWLASMRMIPTTLQPSRSLADHVKKTT